MDRSACPAGTARRPRSCHIGNCDEPVVVGLFWIFYIVDDVADRLTDRAALAGVQRHDTGGGHVGALLSPGVRAKKKQETVP